MKWKRWLLFMGGAAAVAIAASYIGTIRSYLRGEAFYRGKPARYWAASSAVSVSERNKSAGTRVTRRGLSGERGNARLAPAP